MKREKEYTGDNAAPGREPTEESTTQEAAAQGNAAEEGVVEETPEAEAVQGGEDLAKELTAQKEKYLRLMAEFDNYKRRTSREYERMVASANEKLMLEIIDVRESFERALAMPHGDADVATFVEGMKLIFAKLDDVLKKNGMTVFTEVGDEFDPELHDAMLKTPDPAVPDGHIAQIYEKGYRLRDRVIKHARVIVSSGPPEGEQGEGGEQTAPDGQSQDQ